MRDAYSGRSAAYEARGDLARALADHHTLLLLYRVELEILDELEAPERDSFMKEVAKAYRVRARVFKASGRADAAETDLRRATELDTEARKLADARTRPRKKSTDLREMTKQLAELQKELDRARARLKTASESRSFFGPPPPGQVELVNSWTAPVTVILDGTAYTLRPGESRRVIREAGDFTYEVRSVQGSATRKLRAGEIFTIRIGLR